MDLPTVRVVRIARSRSDIAVSETVQPIGGGTWLYSEPQPHLTGVVDLMGMRWRPWERRSDGGLSVAATCTIAELVAIPGAEWPVVPFFRQCATSLLQSFKVWQVATVGGNIVTALAAGSMIGLAATLDAELLIWTPDGGDRRVAVADFVLAQRLTTLRPGEVVRSIEFPPHALAALTGFERIAQSPLGRVGTMVSGRLDADGSTVFVVTGGTFRPEVLRFAGVPTEEGLRARIDAIGSFFSDVHGAADWRHAMSARFAEHIRHDFQGA